jgi:D-arabinose 5-phosphate isomerase GutQ
MQKRSKTDVLAIARGVIVEESRAVAAVAAQLDESIVPIAEAMLACEGHILVTGAGTSRAVAQRMAHLLACCGRPALFINAGDGLHGGSGAVTARDIVYIISKGGQSAEINQFAQIVKGRGARIVAHTENPESALARLSDFVLVVKAPPDADPYGMIATGSSLVNSAACDALCVLVLTLGDYTRDEFGKTHPGGAVGKKLASERP